MISFLIGMLGCWRLYRLKYRVESLLYAWIIQMQLIEFFLWQYQPCSDPIKLNKNLIWTYIGILVNHMEPMILWLALQFLPAIEGSKEKRRQDISGNQSLRLPGTLHWSINLLFGIFCAASIQYSWLAIRLIQCTTVTADSDPHLNWIWNELDGNYEYYALFLVTLNVLSIYGLRNGVTHAILVTTSYLWSLWVYQGHHAIGAMWCFIAAFLPWLIPFAYSIGDRLWDRIGSTFPILLEPGKTSRFIYSALDS